MCFDEVFYGQKNKLGGVLIIYNVIYIFLLILERHYMNMKKVSIENLFLVVEQLQAF